MIYVMTPPRPCKSMIATPWVSYRFVSSYYVSGRSGLVTNCSQRLISASVVDTRILRIEFRCPPGSLRGEPSMRQTARRRRAARFGRSLRWAPCHNSDGVVTRRMRAAPGHSRCERLVALVLIYWLPLCASQRCQRLFANDLANHPPDDYSIVKIWFAERGSHVCALTKR